MFWLQKTPNLNVHPKSTDLGKNWILAVLQPQNFSVLWFHGTCISPCASPATPYCKGRESVLHSHFHSSHLLQQVMATPLDSKEIKPVNPKRNQPWKFIGKTDSEALILWPPDESTHWKRPWCWTRLEAKGEWAAEDEMVRQHHQLSRHESEQTGRQWRT